SVSGGQGPGADRADRRRLPSSAALPGTSGESAEQRRFGSHHIFCGCRRQYPAQGERIKRERRLEIHHRRRTGGEIKNSMERKKNIAAALLAAAGILLIFA